MSNDGLTTALSLILGIMIGVLFLLFVIFLVLKLKETSKGKKNTSAKLDLQKKESTKVPLEYTKQSIFSFMDFDKIEDNMIIKNDGKRFLMVVECQGINYDLMSGVEKVGVEQGFLQYLNTLRYPIQIYTQTRTVNLGNSILNYREKLKEVEDRLVSKQMDYNSKMASGEYTESDLQKLNLEIVKERNLYEYGIDIIKNTEQMSLNKNVLRKYYYIIIAYTPEEINDARFNKEEIKDLAFSDLYTKCQSTMASLAVCGMNCKILNSNQLTELLYVAYNRDDSEIYQLDKALESRYDELYSTAEDILDRKIKELDRKIEEEGIRKANEVLLEVAQEREKEREIKRKEENMRNLINRMAKMVIDDNVSFVGDEAAEKAKEKIDKETKKEGGKVNEKKKRVTRRKTI